MPVFPADMNLVILNPVVNAAYALTEVAGDREDKKGP